jgi:hypothetical protein
LINIPYILLIVKQLNAYKTFLNNEKYTFIFNLARVLFFFRLFVLLKQRIKINQNHSVLFPIFASHFFF